LENRLLGAMAQNYFNCEYGKCCDGTKGAIQRHWRIRSRSSGLAVFFRKTMA
jgi:hypothetical protein